MSKSHFPLAFIMLSGLKNFQHEFSLFNFPDFQLKKLQLIDVFVEIGDHENKKNYLPISQNSTRFLLLCNVLTHKLNISTKKRFLRHHLLIFSFHFLFIIAFLQFKIRKNNSHFITNSASWELCLEYRNSFKLTQSEMNCIPILFLHLTVLFKLVQLFHRRQR